MERSADIDVRRCKVAPVDSGCVTVNVKGADGACAAVTTALVSQVGNRAIVVNGMSSTDETW